MAKKSEKRLALKQLKLQKALKKTVQQLSAPNLSKTPQHIPLNPAKIIPPPEVIPKPQFMTYSSGHEDREGAWSWQEARDWGDECWQRILEPYLKNYHNKKTWAEIASECYCGQGRMKKKHKSYPKGTITKEARDRLVALKKDDLEETIFRFRMNNLRRLYGFRISGVFYHIWYDPKHKICPTN